MKLVVRRWSLLGLFLLALAGCSSQQRAAPVDPTKAHEALKTALASWKKGDTLESLKTATPAITVQDFDWMGGVKLVDYQISGDAKDDDANLRIPVKLTLRDPNGKEVQKQV